MQSRHLLVALGVVVLGLVSWFALREGAPAAPAETLVQTVQPEADAPPDNGDSLVDLGAGAMDATATRESAAVEAVAAQAVEDEHPWAGMLAGLTGRLVEKDGSPVVAMRVELIEADASLLFSAEHAALGTKELEIGDVRPDSDGRFLFEGARDGAFHVLNIDRGGGRATVRLVEQSVTHGELTDLGDIVMEEFGILIGTVIDEDGEPVPGARVRATVIPDIAVQTGILDIRPGIVVRGDDDSFAFEPPNSAYALLDRLPVPTTTTLEDGSFRLEGVPLGMVSGGVDLEKHVAATIGPVLVTATEVDVGELELLFGRTVTGTVKDLNDEPVSGVSVCAGALHPLFDVAIMQPGGVSDEKGTFEIRGVPEDGSIVGAIRRHRSEPWVLGEAAGGGTEIHFVVPTAGKMICTILDEEDQPLDGADITLRMSAEEGSEMAWMTSIAMAGRMPNKQTKVKGTDTPGVYLVEDLALGKWTVEARVPGRAIVREEVVHEGGETRVTMRAPKGQMIRVTVTDAVTGEPVPKAHATLLGPEGFLFTAMASAFTRGDGVTELGPLAPEWHEDAMSDAVWMKEAVVSVEHPLYGMTKTVVPEGATEVFLEMPPACTLQGTVTWGGGPPGNVYMVLLRWKDDKDAMAQAMMLPRTTLTNLEGRFKLTGLAPGAYEAILMERYFDGNPIKLIMEQTEPTMVDQADVVVDPEQPTEMVFELSPDGMGPTGSFGGRVTIDGNAVSGAEVKVGRRDPDIYYTDSNGEFQTEEYPIISGLRVVIMADVPLADGGTENQEVFSSWRRPKRDEVMRIDVELSFKPIEVQVIDAETGIGVPDVNLRLSGGGGWRGRRGGNRMKTDSQGMASTVLPDKKEYSLVATNKMYAQASVKVQADSVKDGLVTIELEREVVCAGRVVLPPDFDTTGKLYINVTAPGFEGNWTPINNEDMTFEMERMSPGDFQARIWNGPQRGELRASFTLPQGGDSGLLLEFEAVQQEGE